MGLFDVVLVSCPTCNSPIEFQSKGAPEHERLLRRFTLDLAPEDVLSNVNRHSPHQCSCGEWVAVNEQTRQAEVVEPFPHYMRVINGWYQHDELRKLAEHGLCEHDQIPQYCLLCFSLPLLAKEEESSEGEEPDAFCPF